jgi:tRNA threonylcarbamoyladenosine biosynthesis protein TsaB
MRTLAIETATKTVGLALLEEEKILAEVHLDLGRHHAEVLLPALDQLFRISGLNLDQIDLLACTTGPGSFTGVRIGISSIKGLALATGKPVVGVSTLEVLAMNAGNFPQRVCPMLDARKDQIYCGLYRMGKDGFPEPALPERLADLDDWLGVMTDEETLFLGDGALRYEKRIHERFPGRFRLGQGGQHHPRASAVGLIGRSRYREGRILDPLTIAPRYLRLSEAETLCGGEDLSFCGNTGRASERS